MRIFITGVSGLFGLNAALVLGDKGHEVWGSYLTHPVELPGGRALRLDVRDEAEVMWVFREVEPEVVIHAAAATSVDGCEENPGMAQAMNVDATRAVMKGAFHVCARLVHLSTDQVFEGKNALAKESDKPHPINVYGRTKLESEREATLRSDFLIIRTNFFGWGPPHKPSLSDWILARLRAGDEVPGFTDVYFTPILVNDLIGRIEIMLASNVRGGWFHVAGVDRVSKYEFARRLAEMFDQNTEKVRATRVAEAQLRAPRPLDMSLNGSKVDGLLSFPSADLQVGLKRLKDLEAQGWPERIRMLVQPRQVPV